MLLILKIIFIFYLVLLSLKKITEEIKTFNHDRSNIINIVEIIVSILLIFFIYKI